MNLFNEFMFHFQNWYLMFLVFVQMLFILPLSLIFFFPEIIVDSHTLVRNNTEKLHVHFIRFPTSSIAIVQYYNSYASQKYINKIHQSYWDLISFTYCACIFSSVPLQGMQTSVTTATLQSSPLCYWACRSHLPPCPLPNPGTN